MRHASKAMTLAFAAALVFCGRVHAQAQPQPAFEWNPRSGDAWIDRQLDDINRYAGRYRGAFIDELVRYRAAPRELVTELLVERNWAPGDVYYACTFAQIVGRPCRAVIDVWSQLHAEGWSEAVKGLDATPKPDADARIRQGITDSYVRWARPLAKEAGVAADQPTGKKPATARTKAKRR